MKNFSENIQSAALANWDVTLILDNLRSAHNVGNIFRIAEALKVRIIGCGCTPMPPHPVLAKTAMDCDMLVESSIAVSAVEAIKMLRSRSNCQILALEHNSSSVEVWEYSPYRMPLALILGNEAYGVSPEALALCDGAVDLAMLGKKASVNVGNAAAAALYMIYAKCKMQFFNR